MTTNLKTIFLAALAATTSPALADVVFSNLAAGDVYEPEGGYVVADYEPFDRFISPAMSFVSAGSGTLDRIQLAMTADNGPFLAIIKVDVYSDFNGEPADLLVSSERRTLFQDYPAANPTILQGFEFPPELTLLAGEQYWVLVSPVTPLSPNYLIWNGNRVGDRGSIGALQGGFPGWNVRPNEERSAFRVWTAQSDILGSNYCSSLPNSSGLPSTMGAVGSAMASDNNLTLLADGLPWGVFGLFLVSRTQGSVPLGQGNLCLAGSIGRLQAPGQIFQAPSNGRVSMRLDLTQIPQGFGFTAAVAGDTWNFQAWHRDLVGGVLASNLTDGISITFM